MAFKELLISSIFIKDTNSFNRFLKKSKALNGKFIKNLINSVSKTSKSSK